MTGAWTARPATTPRPGPNGPRTSGATWNVLRTFICHNLAWNVIYGPNSLDSSKSKPSNPRPGTMGAWTARPATTLRPGPNGTRRSTPGSARRRQLAPSARRYTAVCVCVCERERERERGRKRVRERELMRGGLCGRRTCDRPDRIPPLPFICLSVLLPISPPLYLCLSLSRFDSWTGTQVTSCTVCPHTYPKP